MPNGVRLNANYPDISDSNELYGRATGLIPAYSQTLAKGPTQYIGGVAPRYLLHGKGARVWDVDGNEYLDYNMGIGPISLGYCYERVDEAIRRQLEDGITFSLVHPLEVQLSEILRETIPNAESVRFGKSGAEVTSAAVRLARAYTGRDRILCCGYHGWHDWYIGVTPRPRGVPKVVRDLTSTFDYNDLDSVHRLLGSDVACVILEPMIFDFPTEGFLRHVQAACRENGSLLVFDEMWTGFRFDLGGAQEFFDVVPDLACYSKSIANGMPLSVLTGRQEIMELLDEQVFFFSTFGGETLSLAAAVATIRELENEEVPLYLASKGRKLRDGYNAISTELGMDSYTWCKGHPSRTLVVFDGLAGDPLLMKSLVQQELIKRGILWSGFHNLCFSHTDHDIDYTLDAYCEALSILKAAVETGMVREMLRGTPVQPVFRKTDVLSSLPPVPVAAAD